MSSIKTLIVDDQPLFAGGLQQLLSTYSHLDVVGQAASGRAALQQVQMLAPDVVLLDMQLPHMEGPEIAERILQIRPGTRIIALTTFSAGAYLTAAIKAGVRGFLVKDVDAAHLVQGIEIVHAGGYALAPCILEEVFAFISRNASTSSKPSEESVNLPFELKAREQDILELLAQGLSNQEVADQLHLSKATVKANLTELMAKFEVRDRVQLLIRALQFDLVKLPEA